MIDSNLTATKMDYKNIFIDIADKLFTKKLLNEEEKVRLINIINKDNRLCGA